MEKQIKYVDGNVVQESVKISQPEIEELRAGLRVYLRVGGTNIMGEGLVIEVIPKKAR